MPDDALLLKLHLPSPHAQVSLQEAFCRVMDGEMILFNANIAAHNRANSYDNHDPIRKRRLLMQKREIRKLKQKQDEKGLTLVPLRMYFRCVPTPF